MKKDIIIGVSIFVVGLGGYFLYLNLHKKRLFNRFVKVVKAEGNKDFINASPKYLKIWYSGFKSLTDIEAKRLVELKEKQQPSASEAIEISQLIGKVAKHIRENK